MTVPNALTLLRILLIPVLVVVYFLPVAWAPLAATATFALAGITDWLDGYLARRLQQTSKFGAFLDPVADKLMVAVALVLLVQTQATVGVSVAAAVIIGREITISALREWMAEIGERGQVKVAMLGKVKTSAQMAAILLMLYREPLAGLPVLQIGVWLLYGAAALTLWSMFVYLRAAWPSLMETAGNGPAP